MNKSRLFTACSMALVVTALTFAIRASLLTELGEVFQLSPPQLGQVASAAFWGFTLAMFIGGPLCDIMGLRNMYTLAFFGHITGCVLTIYATGFYSLFFSTLLIGLGNGFIESASYTLVSSMYSDNKAKKINDWHIWFPGGIVIGGCIAYLLSLLHFSWKIQIGFILLPTVAYGILFYRQPFPKSERIMLGISTKAMIAECFRPLFLFMLACMLLTAATELGTNQWIVALLADNGVPSILLLVFINGIMALGRWNAGSILRRISSIELLLFSAVLAFIGLFWMSYARGAMNFAAAGIFAAGICFFWPTMIGFVAEKLPRTGPLGLSLMGGTGLLSTALILPLMGTLYSHQVAGITSRLQAAGTDARTILTTASLEGGAATLRWVSLLPAVLIIAFSGLYIRMRISGNSNVAPTPAIDREN